MSHDPSLSSVPLLISFLKAYGRPFIGIIPGLPGPCDDGDAPQDGITEDQELIEKDVRDRFKRMCEGYYDNVAKILLKEHHVSVHGNGNDYSLNHGSKRLQEQERRNHEAYIRSGEIFEDRQQAYEKMTRGYEKLLSNCQTYVCICRLHQKTNFFFDRLSELLNLPMPSLPASTQKTDSIGLSTGNRNREEDNENLTYGRGTQWEDEEERKFYEDIIDLKDCVPKALLNINETETESSPKASDAELESADIERLLDPSADAEDEAEDE